MQMAGFDFLYFFKVFS